MKKERGNTSYLFVTDAEQYPVEGVTSEGGRWSCSKAALPGDVAFVYVKGVGIAYEWKIMSPAERDKRWKYMCDVEYLRTLRPPIEIGEIRSTFSRAEWPAPYTNFRGFRSIRLSEDVYAKLRNFRKPGSSGEKRP